MRLLLNIIWLVFGGLLMALGYAIAGIVMFILIITIPFGIAAFRIALFCLWPFGRTIIRRGDAGAASLIGNMTFAGVANQTETIATWLTRLEEVRGWVNPWVNSAQEDTPVAHIYTFSNGLDLTQAVLHGIKSTATAGPATGDEAAIDKAANKAANWSAPPAHI